MSVDFNKLYNPDNEEISSDISEVDEILELNEIYYVISKKLIEYRQQNDLTQEKLAEKIKVNQTMISKLESGKYNPTFKLVYKISRKLENSSEIFKEILEEIIQNLDNIKNIEFTKKIEENYLMDIKKSYSNSSKIIYFQSYYNKNKGEKDYEQYQSKSTIVG